MKRILLFIAILLVSIISFGQELNSGYFLENNTFRYRFNPAFSPDTSIANCFGFIIGNISVNPQSNVGLSSFIFPYDDKLVTGLNENISDDTFLGGLQDNNFLNLGADLNLISVGSRAKSGSFLSVEVNIKSSTRANIPASLFTFLKQGSSENSFDIKNMNISNSEYMELALSFSRKFGRYVSAGFRIKGLVGLFRTDICVDEMILKINTEAKAIDISSSGYARVFSPLLSIQTRSDESGQTLYDTNSIHVGTPGLAGVGAALDLGISATPVEGLEISASAADIGGLWWKSCHNGTLASQSTYYLSGGNTSVLDLTKGIINVVPKQVEGKKYIQLPYSLRFGAKYDMPFYDRLSVGMLGSFKKDGNFYYNEIRMGAAVSPFKYISISANYGITTYGSVFGLAGNLNLGPFQIYAGTDGLITKFSPQYIPLNAFNSVINAGIILLCR